MQEVVKQLSERMVQAGHRVTVFTSHLPERSTGEINGVRIRAFNVKGNAVRGMTGEVDAYRKALVEGRFDVVAFFAAQQWTTDAMLPHLHELNAAKVFVPTGFSALYAPEYAGYYAEMPAWLRAMDLNVFLSDDYRDVDFARKNGVTAMTLIPNGAAEEEFEGPLRHDLRSEHGVPADSFLILHVGSYSGQKGHSEAIRIFLAAERTKGATLMLIGNGTRALQRTYNWRRWWLLPRWKARLTGRRVLFLELDRARTVAAMRQADLFLFPSNVECSPIVLFEAMAAGTPFLCSNAGNSAEIASWSGSGSILPGTRNGLGYEVLDIAGGACALDRLLADRVQLRAKAALGSQAWKERFTWRGITEQYLAHYQQLVPTRHG